MANAAVAADEEEEEAERLMADAELGALRGGALALARSAAFLARWVAKVYSFAALSAVPVSQVSSLVVVVIVTGDWDGAGTGVAVVAVATVVGLEARLVDLGMGVKVLVGRVQSSE